MQLLKSLEQITKEVKEKTKEISEQPEWKKEFERIQAIVWEKGRDGRKEWVQKHKIKKKLNNIWEM